MCIGRSMNFEPSRSARPRSSGPRSMLNIVTNPAATIAVTIASTARSARTNGRRRRTVVGTTGSTRSGAAEGSSPAGCVGGSSGWSVIGRTGWLFDDYQNAAGLDRRAHGDRNVLDAARFRRSQLIFHLHSFDDDDRLAGGDLVARPHENPNDAPRHRRDDRLRALTPAARIAASSPRASSVDAGRCDLAVEPHQDVTVRPRGHDLRFTARSRVAIDDKGQREVTDANGIDEGG